MAIVHMPMVRAEKEATLAAKVEVGD